MSMISNRGLKVAECRRNRGRWCWRRSDEPRRHAARHRDPERRRRAVCGRHRGLDRRRTRQGPRGHRLVAPRAPSSTSSSPPPARSRAEDGRSASPRSCRRSSPSSVGRSPRVARVCRTRRWRQGASSARPTCRFAVSRPRCAQGDAAHETAGAAVIAEIKKASPSQGVIRPDSIRPRSLVVPGWRGDLPVGADRSPVLPGRQRSPDAGARQLRPARTAQGLHRRPLAGTGGGHDRGRLHPADRRRADDARSPNSRRARRIAASTSSSRSTTPRNWSAHCGCGRRSSGSTIATCAPSGSIWYDADARSWRDRRCRSPPPSSSPKAAFRRRPTSRGSAPSASTVPGRRGVHAGAGPRRRPRDCLIGGAMAVHGGRAIDGAGPVNGAGSAKAPAPVNTACPGPSQAAGAIGPSSQTGLRRRRLQRNRGLDQFVSAEGVDPDPAPGLRRASTAFSVARRSAARRPRRACRLPTGRRAPRDRCGARSMTSSAVAPVTRAPTS